MKMSSGDSLFPKTVVDFLHEKGYSHVDHLGEGGFGEVLSAHSPKQEKVDIKIVNNKKMWHIEELIWPVLRHKNILPLLEMIDISYLNVKLFAMPKIPYVLDTMLYSNDFMIDKMGLKRVKRWLSDCEEGLKYLHTSGFAHLDLKQDNILISADDQALLCDFSGINLTGVPLRRLIAPLKFRPPEYYDEILYGKLEASQCDIWMYGLMALNILTKDWPSRRIGRVTDAPSWKMNVEPVLREVLKKSTFCNIMKAAFPSVVISDEDITLGHNFVVSLLQRDVDKRPSIQEIGGHPFLTSSESQGILVEEKAKIKEVKCFVTNPFLKGWIDPEKASKNKSVNEYEAENDEQNVTLKFKPQHFEKEEAVIISELTNVVTNPFLEGWVGFRVINENSQDQEDEIEKDEQNNSMKRYSHQQIEETEMMDKSENILPLLVELKENSVSKIPNDIYKIKKELPKDKKKIGGSIKSWFVKKWCKAFKKKKNNYERLSDESE